MAQVGAGERLGERCREPASAAGTAPLGRASLAAPVIRRQVLGPDRRAVVGPARLDPRANPAAARPERFEQVIEAQPLIMAAHQKRLEIEPHGIAIIERGRSQDSQGGLDLAGPTTKPLRRRCPMKPTIRRVTGSASMIMPPCRSAGSSLRASPI